MEEKKTIIDYAAQVLTIFGFNIIVMNLFCVIFGDSAESVSGMLSLGNQGLSVGIVFQFFLISVLVVIYRVLFFTDLVIKQMSIVLRTALQLGLIIVTVVIFVILFQWFPVNMWEPWLMFALCFGVSFLVSLAVMSWKEKLENKQMEDALKKLKEREDMS